MIIMGEDNELLNFDWETDSATEDFFGTKSTTDTVVPEKPTKQKPKVEDKDDNNEPAKPKGKDKSKNTDPDPEDIEDDEDEDFFDGINAGTKAKLKGGEAGDDNTDDEDKGESSGSIYADVFKDLKENGIFKHVELDEEEELDADRLFELQQEEYEAEVSARLQNWATNELDDDAKAFIKFKTQGGSTEDFFKAYSKSTDLPVGDIEDEDHQDDVIRYQLRSEGWDRDEIEDRLEYLTESGKKQKIAQKYSEKLKEQDQKNKQNVIAQAEQNKLKLREQEEEFKTSVKSALEETDDLAGLKITKEDKQRLLNLITKKEHKVSDTRSVTGLQKKLAEAFQDVEKLLKLAVVLDKDFDMSDFEKKAKTTTSKRIKSNLEQRQSLRPNNSGSSLGGSSLADLF